MKDFFAFLGIAVLAGALLLGALFGGLFLYRALAPEYEKAGREVYEQTPSYVQGKEQFLSRLRGEWYKANTPEQKASLKELILSEASTVDRKSLSPSLQLFLRDVEEAK